MNLKKSILEKCKSMGINMVGIAPIDRWSKSLPPLYSDKGIPEEFWPQSIYPETKSVIVIGLPVQLPILETTPSIYYYTLYQTINRILDDSAYKLSNFLMKKGYESIFTPRDGYGDIYVLLETCKAFFSQKHAAYLAGLGSPGYSSVLLTPEFGPRVRFVSVLTSANIQSDPILKQDLCTRCKLCAISCPSKAIPMDDSEFPPKIDKIKCAKYSEVLRRSYRSPCGICIKVCPIGNDRKLF
ncbi:MAG TPA: epoxyqueuosine reductase, partial [Methanosarcinales archaeon]|nr:epoxyqueuosine reductase [Methanosarcinales archaeon]